MFHKDPKEVNEDHVSVGQVVVQGQTKISAETGLYTGEWAVPESGILIVELSNAHSRFTGRTIKWSMEFME